MPQPKTDFEKNCRLTPMNKPTPWLTPMASVPNEHICATQMRYRVVSSVSEKRLSEKVLPLA